MIHFIFGYLIIGLVCYGLNQLQRCRIAFFEMPDDWDGESYENVVFGGMEGWEEFREKYGATMLDYIKPQIRWDFSRFEVDIMGAISWMFAWPIGVAIAAILWLITFLLSYGKE